MSKKAENVFEKLAKQVQKNDMPTYEEAVSKDDMRRGATAFGAAVGTLPGLVSSFKGMDSVKFPLAKNLGILGAGMTGGAVLGRTLLGSDKMYEKGRESYKKQMKDPKIRKSLYKQWEKQNN